MAVDPFAEWRADSAPAYQPSTGASGSFADWLRSLPTPQQISPLSPYVSGRKGETGIGPNQVPALWLQFAPQGEELINLEHDARMGGQMAGVLGARREFERGTRGVYQSSGIDPIFARTALAETLPQVGERLSAIRGESNASRYEDIFGHRAGIINALAQASAMERSLGLNAYMASRARKTARAGAKSAMTAQLGAAGLDFLSSFAPSGGGTPTP